MYKERIAGIALGIVLGLGVVALFVFVFSEDAIDSASLGGQSASGPTEAGKKPQGKPQKSDGG